MVVNYCATGTDAFRYGVFAVACGMYDTVLVVGFDKPQGRGVAGPSVAVTGVRGLPATPAGWFSHCAARYFETYGAGREDLARIAVKNHHNGTLAPKSMLKREITVDDVLKARIISWPFGLYDCAAQSDVAAAAFSTRRELAKRFRDDFVLVRAIAIALAPDPKEDPDFDFLRWKPTVYAARQAYEQAGIANPRKEIDLAQVHDCFTLTELLAYEDLGFCEKGAAKDYIKSGTFELSGELPVNTDGGMKTFGHPTGATGDGTYAPAMAAQARRALEIIGAAIEALGGRLEHVVRTRMFVTDISKSQELSAVHGAVFGDIRPAATLVEISRLIHPDAQIEIEADAILPPGA